VPDVGNVNVVAPLVVSTTECPPLNAKDELDAPKLLIELAFASNPLFTEKLFLVAGI
jgi:hypothetical protein